MSVTGNTKKIAQSIYDAIADEKEFRELKKLNSLEGYDLIFLGFPIHDFDPPKQAKSLIEKGINQQQVARQCRIWDKSDYFGRLRRFTLKQLGSLLSELAMIDYGLKTGRTSVQNSLEQLVIKVSIKNSK